MLDTIELVEMEHRNNKWEPTWYSRGELATLREIANINQRAGWCQVRPKTGEK